MLLVLVTPQLTKAATLSINKISPGKVIFVGGQKFVKIGVDSQKGSKFISLTHAPVCALGTTETMQSWTGCSLLPTPVATGYTQGPCLADERDGKTYEVRKFADGKCWMADNLMYGGATDACASKTSYTGTANLSGAAWGYGDCRNNPSDLVYGYLYNWQAAVQAAAAYYGNDYQPPEPTQGICPAGWHLPSGNITGEFAILDIANGGTGAYRDNCTASSCNFWRPGYSFKGVYAGDSADSGALSYQGSEAYWWSSTQTNGTVGTASYNLPVDSSDATPDDGSVKYRGFSIRCIKN